MAGFHKTTHFDIPNYKNYQIDAIKLFLAVCIFLYHARLYAPAGSLIREVSNKFGWFSVHFFFVISGLFMANSYFKTKDASGEDCGKQSLMYVLKKMKSIAPLYYITFSMDFIVCYLLTIYNDMTADRLGIFIDMLVKAVPELLTLQMCGIRPIGINSITWYLSAMFLAMLPMYYIMKKKPDFFFYILSPLMAIFLFAFFYNSGEPLYDQNNFVLVFSGGFLRACCGISFGAVSYLLSAFFKTHITHKKQMICITALELLLTLLCMIVWIKPTLDSKLLYPAAFLFPVMLSIIHSEKSYVSKLFKCRFFRYFGTWSTWLYLNHFAARRIIDETSLFEAEGYAAQYVCMLAITLLSCVLCYAIKWLAGKIRMACM